MSPFPLSIQRVVGKGPHPAEPVRRGGQTVGGVVGEGRRLAPRVGLGRQPVELVVAEGRDVAGPGGVLDLHHVVGGVVGHRRHGAPWVDHVRPPIQEVGGKWCQFICPMCGRRWQGRHGGGEVSRNRVSIPHHVLVLQPRQRRTSSTVLQKPQNRFMEQVTAL
jgi:hypothetical protein